MEGPSPSAQSPQLGTAAPSQESRAQESDGRSARPQDGEQDRTPHCSPAWSPLCPTPCSPRPFLCCLQVPKPQALHSEPRDNCRLPRGPAGAQRRLAPGPGLAPRGHERLTLQNTLDSGLRRSEASVQVFINKTTSFSGDRRDPALDLKAVAEGTPQTQPHPASGSDQDGATGTRVTLLLKTTEYPDTMCKILVSRDRTGENEGQRSLGAGAGGCEPQEQGSQGPSPGGAGRSREEVRWKCCPASWGGGWAQEGRVSE